MNGTKKGHQQLSPACFNNGGYEAILEAQPYSTLYGAQGTFTTDGHLMLILDAPWTKQHMGSMGITLFLHRVSRSSEVPPTNGFYTVRQQDIISVDVDDDVTYDAHTTYNNVTVGDGQNLVEIVGIRDVSVFNQASSGKDVFSGYVSYDSPTKKLIINIEAGIRSNYTALLYAYSCDASCATCIGPLASNCLTCIANLALKNGMCKIPVVCDSSCFTCSGPAANQCETCAGNLQTLNGECTCPNGQFVNNTNTNFDCSACHSTC